jgi:TonB family protein
VRFLVPVCILILSGAACRRASQTVTPLTPATLVGGNPAIPYPPALFAARVEGEVMLYLVVDSTGTVVRDSTRIARSSGQTAFDAAALQAAAALHFNAARRGTQPVTAPIQIPIQFTLPDSLKTPRKPS